MKNLLKLTLVATVIGASLSANADVLTAKRILDEASTKAKASGKNVLVIFHASWCGWCHKLDNFLATPTGQKVSHGVEIVHLTVQEDPKHKADENPGGDEVLKQLKGDQAGLPFYAILSPSGKMLANSSKNPNKMENIGYPAEPDEIKHFMSMLQVGAPKLTSSERIEISTWLTKNAPKSTGH